jgi:hypothetical protein
LYFVQRIQEILNQVGSTARAYLLTANRPFYSLDAYAVDKNKLEFDVSLSYSKDVAEVPLSLSYGISDNFRLETGIDLYIQSYSFSGQKISGLGDANLGFGYKFHESQYFTHSFQTLLKIPTARLTAPPEISS